MPHGHPAAGLLVFLAVSGAALGTEVEVRFVAEGPGTTRVELEHRRLERYAQRAAEMRAIFESEGGWSALLAAFARAAAKR